MDEPHDRTRQDDSAALQTVDRSRSATAGAPRLVLVVGMHRSGTSAVTRLLSLCGGALPDDLIGPGDDNPDGFWESKRVVLLHDEILESLGASWQDAREFPRHFFDTEAAADWRTRLYAAIALRLTGEQPLLLKDPRLCRLLPLWRSLCQERGIALSVVLPVRNPLEVAASLAKRNQLSKSDGLLLWLRHFIDAEHASRGLQRYFISYDELMERGPAAVLRIASALAMQPTGDEQRQEIANFLRPDHRHHRASLDDLRNDASCPEWVKRAYDWGAAAAERGEPPTAGLDEIRNDLRAAEQIYRPLVEAAEHEASERLATSVRLESELAAQREMTAAVSAQRDATAQFLATQHSEADRLRLRLGEVEDEWHFAEWYIHELQASTSWRVTTPLRWFSRALRDIPTWPAAATRWLVAPAYRLVTPRFIRAWVAAWRRRLDAASAVPPANVGETVSLHQLVDQRCTFAATVRRDPFTAAPPEAWPDLDITIVTHNSEHWLGSFFDSLLEQDYPTARIHLLIVDNASTDGTMQTLAAFVAANRQHFANIDIMARPNDGFGAGHNAAICAGRSTFVLVTNVDLEFDRSSLTRAVTIAVADAADVAAWELRQRPYEHPKLYDPVTGVTAWSSCACLLLRRSAFEQVGGFDQRIFMYGEDVDLSYRLRQAGFQLRYCARAAVVHHSYEAAEQVKPLQFSGSVFANLLLRLKFGTWHEIAAIPLMVIGLLRHAEPYPGAHKDAMRVARRAAVLAPGILATRTWRGARQPFRGWDYEIARSGAFVPANPLPEHPPLVTVITRTYRGREVYLAQALLSVAHQTYPNVEHIVVEDGGAVMLPVVERISALTGRPIRHIQLAKVGRSAAGNAGLAAATGEFIVFLDDDDLFFQDHLETLVSAITDNEAADAAYALAWEVVTDTSRMEQGRYSETRLDVNAVFFQPYDFDVLRHHNYLPIQAVLFRRSLYLERGGFDVSLDCLEDWNLWQRYGFGRHFVYVAKVTSLYRTPAEPAIRAVRAGELHAAYDNACARTDHALAQLARSDATNA